jgi:hypothetical protein
MRRRGLGRRGKLETSKKSASNRGRSVVLCASTRRRSELGLDRTDEVARRT